MALGEATLEDRVVRLEDDVGRILASLSAVESLHAAELYVTQVTIEAGIKRELKALELRHRIFPEAAHDQVAWSMLLAAHKYAAPGRQLPVTALCTFACSPDTTALRWLGVLEQAELLRSGRDANDGRRRLMSITDTARGLMVRYFTALDH
jgi:hypothetical protein